MRFSVGCFVLKFFEIEDDDVVVVVCSDVVVFF